MRRAVAAAVLVTVLLGAPAGVAEAAAPAGLSVSISNASSEVHTGEKLAYTATIRNEGTDVVEGRLVVTVPPYVRVATARDADRVGSDAIWAVAVPAGGSVTKKLTGVLKRIPPGELRVTTLVSFYIGDATQPAIRSAEADSIAGVKDTAHAVNDQDASPPAALPIGWIGLGVAAIVLAAASILVWRLARRRV